MSKAATTTAACFLMDYEARRSPTLSPNQTRITDRQLELYQIKFSSARKVFGLTLATIFLFVNYLNNRSWTLLLHMYAVLIFLVDLYMRNQILDKEAYAMENGNPTGRRLIPALVLFLALFGVQSLSCFFLAHPEKHFSTILIYHYSNQLHCSTYKPKSPRCFGGAVADCEDSSLGGDY
jgi:hypothetical protein